MDKRPHLPHRLDEAELQFHVELWSPDGNRRRNAWPNVRGPGWRRLRCREQSRISRSTNIIVRQGAVERLRAGDSDEQVKSYIVGRYGAYVLLKPPPAP